MKAKPLAQTNPYLRNSEKRTEMTRANVISSSAVENINVKYSEKKSGFVINKNIDSTSRKA